MRQTLYWAIHRLFPIFNRSPYYRITGSILQMKNLRLRQGMDLPEVTQLIRTDWSETYTHLTMPAAPYPQATDPDARPKAQCGEDGIAGGWTVPGLVSGSPCEGTPPRPPYLVIHSPGNSQRLTASSSVRKTGMISTFGGSTTPRITKQHGRGCPLGQRRQRGSNCSGGDMSNPHQLRGQYCDPASSPEQKP